MESRGIAGTGRPVGPDGRSGSCGGFFVFRCPCVVAVSATLSTPRLKSPTHRTTTPAICYNFHPVLITIPPRNQTSGDTTRPLYRNSSTGTARRAGGHDIPPDRTSLDYSLARIGRYGTMGDFRKSIVVNHFRSGKILAGRTNLGVN